MNKEDMKKELDDINIALNNWAKKYHKNHVSMFCISGSRFASVTEDDEDCDLLNIHLLKEDTE